MVLFLYTVFDILSVMLALYLILLCRLLFKFVLKIFYGTIVVENADVIPPNGRPWFVTLSCLSSTLVTVDHSIVCANHSNSLTDALYVHLVGLRGVYLHNALTTHLIEFIAYLSLRYLQR